MYKILALTAISLSLYAADEPQPGSILPEARIAKDAFDVHTPPGTLIGRESGKEYTCVKLHEFYGSLCAVIVNPQGHGCIESIERLRNILPESKG